MDKHKFLPRAKLIERKSFLIQKCRGKSIMHLGCTCGFLDETSILKYSEQFSEDDYLHPLLVNVAACCAGLDISEEKIQCMKSAGIEGEFYVADITDKRLTINDKYDIVVFADLIEHIDNVGNALRNCKKMMTEKSELIITTVNAFDIKTIIKLFLNYESVHLEHTAYFSYLTLRRILRMNGFKIVEFYYSKEARKRYGNPIDYACYKLGNAFSSVFHQYSQGLIAVARILDQTE